MREGLEWVATQLGSAGREPRFVDEALMSLDEQRRRDATAAPRD